MLFNELIVEAIILDELEKSILVCTDSDGSIDRDWTEEERLDVSNRIIQKLKQLNDK